MTPTDIDRIERNVEHLATATARLARQMGLYKTAAELTAQVYGPDCALCGEPCHHSFRADSNVHADCWRREKADGHREPDLSEVEGEKAAGW